MLMSLVRVADYSPQRAQQRLAKTGVRLVKHARYYGCWLRAITHGGCSGAWYGGSARWQWRAGEDRRRADEIIATNCLWLDFALLA